MALVSCEADTRTDTPLPEGEKTVAFTLSTSTPATGNTRGVTRAIDDIVANEGVIDGLDIFFFAGQTCLFYPETSQLDHNGATGKVTIKIPESVYTALDAAPFTIHVVANRPDNLDRDDFSGKTLDQLYALVAENDTAMAFNLGEGAPARFLMTGSSAAPVDITPEGQDLGNIVLRRAAAKIVVNIVNADINGYTPGTARVRLTNFLNKTVVGPNGQYDAEPEEYFSNGWRPLDKGDGGDPKNPYGMNLENSLYTYSNDWRDRADRETYITLELEWVKESDGVSRLYYYRIPFSYINAADEAAAAANRGKIRRNHVYRFDVDVTMLGGLDPEDALDLEANFDVIDWGSKEIEVSILSFDYLFVYDPVVTTSEGSHRYEYRSSINLSGDNVTITLAQCTAYLGAAGTPTVINYLNDPRLRISLSEADGKTYLTVNAWRPINYVPLEIWATLDNGEGLTADVELRLMPDIYVTVTQVDPENRTNGMFYGSGSYTTPTGTGTNSTTTGDNPGMSSGVQNDKFYEITSTVPSAQTILIAGVVYPIQVGDPTVIATSPFTGGNAPTAAWLALNPEYRRTSGEMQNVVSPRFIMASRRGAHNPFAWTSAAERCARYREAQYPAGTWRVPTYAELALISMMQRDDNSAIKDLLSTSAGATTWWTARTTTSIEVSRYNDYMAANGVSTAANQAARNVRCVRDTWRIYPQDYFGRYGVYREGD
jgi:hypothetical protein